MLFLKRLELRDLDLDEGDFDEIGAGEASSDAGDFPFSLPVLQNFELRLSRPVTFLVGENGCGKSTLLESLAVASGAVALGSFDLERDPTLEAPRRLASRLRIGRGSMPRTTMFFRAEDAFGYTQRLQSEMTALETLEEEFREQFEEGSWGQRLAMGTARGQRRALEERYGEDPDAASHGETFLHLLEERLTPNGLYILDEPETPLSPLRILTLLRLIHERVERGCQFVIATHSPLLMAFPGAHLFQLTDAGIEAIEWEDVEHVQLTRAFLADRDRYLHRLLED